MKHCQTLPDPANTPVWSFSLSLSLSLSLADLALSGWSHVSSLADAVHPEGTPWILLRLDPGTHRCMGLPLDYLSCFIGLYLFLCQFHTVLMTVAL